MDESTKRFLEMFDDTKLTHRVYMLDTLADGSTEVVASELLTERESLRRLHECSKSRRPMSVEEYYVEKYRALEPGESVKSSIFCSHSTLGTVGMLWELLARARGRKESDQ